MFWAVIGLLMLVFWKPTGRLLAAMLDISEPPRNCDAIFVPAGDAFLRLPAAIDLLANPGAGRLLLTASRPNDYRGQAREIYKLEITDDDMNRRILDVRGLASADTVVRLGLSSSTWDDGRLLREYLARSPARTVMVVSSWTHLKRVRLVLDRVFQNSDIVFIYVGANTIEEDLRRRDEPSDVHQLIFKEWIKYFFYLFGSA